MKAFFTLGAWLFNRPGMQGARISGAIMLLSLACAAHGQSEEARASALYAADKLQWDSVVDTAWPELVKNAKDSRYPAQGFNLDAFSLEDTQGAPGVSYLNFLARDGMYDALLQALHAGVKFPHSDNYDAMYTAVIEAKKHENPYLTMALVSSIDQWNIAHRLAARNKVKELRELDKKVLMARTEFGRNALMLAILYQNKEAVKYLSSHQALLNQKDDFGWSVMMYAVYVENPSILDVLFSLPKPPNVNLQSYACVDAPKLRIAMIGSRMLRQAMSGGGSPADTRELLRQDATYSRLLELSNKQRRDSCKYYLMDRPYHNWLL
ncbi:ankyrin repeat domain-containing protein [Hahella sp. KA22]|uniref:ankyrin repeat domain-containing protein n=1 Tax=Hahella sp. KA22 TaxID=1628392 RepID=UPI000FDED9F5|nr:ankyrin repeat domain-containing protein [Hahella sp. KA22]AZZ90336.1 ankyrin repeat domain-containing protein [Hahella sp. KA22]QAY53707.1 ankyrin repeat domain-containing protein [Hahella sp. KA22]